MKGPEALMGNAASLSILPSFICVSVAHVKSRERFHQIAKIIPVLFLGGSWQ